MNASRKILFAMLFVVSSRLGSLCDARELERQQDLKRTRNDATTTNQMRNVSKTLLNLLFINLMFFHENARLVINDTSFVLRTQFNRGASHTRSSLVVDTRRTRRMRHTRLHTNVLLLPFFFSFHMNLSCCLVQCMIIYVLLLLFFSLSLE
jgi:hypothetical protein